MKITLYHDALIPPKKYGGTERILYWLSKALSSLGHEVVLIARPGSLVPGVELIEYSSEKGKSWQDLVPTDSDILHLWSTPQVLPKKPFLVTIEGNGQIGEIFHPNTVFVSRKHAENHGSRHFVYNGIDPSEYLCEQKRENYLVFLAKASWKVKNLVGAIEIARKAKMPLHVLGSRNWPLGLQRYLRLFRKDVRYYGMVGDEEKKQVLKKAKALLFPVRWHEPFGIAITEALASGCPVFGTPYGSLPEIVTSQTGFLSVSAEDHISALVKKEYSQSICRERVYQGFTHFQMAESYLQYYELILKFGRLDKSDTPAEPISLRLTQSAQELLPWIHTSLVTK